MDPVAEVEPDMTWIIVNVEFKHEDHRWFECLVPPHKLLVSLPDLWRVWRILCTIPE